MVAWVDIAARVDEQLKLRVSEQRIPCFDYAICQQGQLVASGHGGWASMEEGRPLGPRGVFRMFSMTKPITSVMALMLVDQGTIGLDEPISNFVPDLGAPRVIAGVDSDGAIKTRPAVAAITLRHLLTHTAGLTYHFMTVPGPYGRVEEGPIQQLYRERGIKPAAAKIAALPGDAAPIRTGAELLKSLGSVPLIDDPGAQFHYSVATDVIGLVVERLTGTSLGTVLRARLFEPLGMKDTGFRVRPAAAHRFTSNYRFRARRPELVDTWNDSDYLGQPSFESGGGGLVSTTADYVRFLEMLRRGGEIDGHRFLGAQTCELLCRSQLSTPVLKHSNLEVSAGTLFGLGLGIYADRRLANTPVPEGSLFWNGAAGTCCWIDPRHGVTAVVMTQLLENDADRLDRVLHRVVYDDDGRPPGA